MLSQIYKGSTAVPEPLSVANGSFNAQSGAYYIAGGSLTNFVDPPNPSNGSAYTVLAVGASTVIGGQSFPARTLLYRYFNGQWLTSAYASTVANHAVALSNFFQNPTSANLALLLTDENGIDGGFLRATAPTIQSPTILGPATLTQQSSVNDGDLMNRILTLLTTTNIVDLTAATNGGALGSGATIRRNGGINRVVDGDLQTSAAANATFQINLSSGGFEGHWDLSRAIAFNRRWILYKKITLSAASNVQQFFIMGQNNIAINALGLPSSGDSAGWVLDTATSMRLWRCNNGVVTFSTPFDPTSVQSANITTAHHIWLECDGANTLRLFVTARPYGTGVPPRPVNPQATLSGLPNFANANGVALCLRATANNPSAFSSQNFFESKLINF